MSKAWIIDVSICLTNTFQKNQTDGCCIRLENKKQAKALEKIMKKHKYFIGFEGIGEDKKFYTIIHKIKQNNV